MSKSLADEYEAMVQEEAPDLWNRIEAKLDEKEAPPKVLPSGRKRLWYYGIGGGLAACLCVAVLLPVLSRRNQDVEYMEMASEEAPLQDSGANTGIASPDNPEMAGAGEYLIQEQDDRAEKQEAAIPAEDLTEDILAAMKEELSVLESGEELSGMRVTVLSEINEGRGTAYMATVIRDENHIFSEGTVIVFEAFHEGQEGLNAGVTYELKAVYHEENPYWLKAASVTPK